MSKSVLPPRKSYQDYIKSSGLTAKEKEDVLKADSEASKNPLSSAQKLAQIKRAEDARENSKKNES